MLLFLLYIYIYIYTLVDVWDQQGRDTEEDIVVLMEFGSPYQGGELESKKSEDGGCDC